MSKRACKIEDQSIERIVYTSRFLKIKLMSRRVKYKSAVRRPCLYPDQFQRFSHSATTNQIIKIYMFIDCLNKLIMDLTDAYQMNKWEPGNPQIYKQHNNLNPPKSEIGKCSWGDNTSLQNAPGLCKRRQSGGCVNM